MRNLEPSGTTEGHRLKHPNEIEKITVNQVVRQSLDAFTTVTKKNESITLYYYNYKPEIPTDD